jgi:hypothetical protein
VIDKGQEPGFNLKEFVDYLTALSFNRLNKLKRKYIFCGDMDQPGKERSLSAIKN